MQRRVLPPGVTAVACFTSDHAHLGCNWVYVQELLAVRSITSVNYVGATRNKGGA